MTYTNKHSAGTNSERIFHALLILPAVVLGVLAMIYAGISPALWGQQLAAWAFFALLIWPMQRVFDRIPRGVLGVLLFIPLAATLFGEEAGGARRWIDLGVFNANAAMLVLPALLVVLCREKCLWPIMLAAAVVLSLQPDLPQLIAFGAAAMVALWRGEIRWRQRVGSVVLLSLLVIRCMYAPVLLEPVSYCEGILALLGEISPLLSAAGWAALAAVPAAQLIRFFKRRETHALSLAVYYAAGLLFAGKSPVMFMGFGLSPIAGYNLAYLCKAAADRGD